MKVEIMRAVWNVSGPQGKECEFGLGLVPKKGPLIGEDWAKKFLGERLNMKDGGAVNKTRFLTWMTHEWH